MARVADIDAGQALDAVGEMIVGGGPVDQPPACAYAISRSVAPAAVILRQVGIFEAQEMKLGIARGCEFFVVVGFLKTAALGEGPNHQKGGNEGSRDFEKSALHYMPCFN